MSGKSGLVSCFCQGDCPGFSTLDISRVLSKVRREQIFNYVCLHPQLCAKDGEEFLKTLLASGETEKLYIAACDPDNQCQLLCDAFTTIDFNKLSYFALDILNSTDDEAISAIKELSRETAGNEESAG
jgi:heterodisulfide reductase subunit A-like polyferredoxin